jgi:hypothetical protein
VSCDVGGICARFWMLDAGTTNKSRVALRNEKRVDDFTVGNGDSKLNTVPSMESTSIE